MQMPTHVADTMIAHSARHDAIAPTFHSYENVVEALGYWMRMHPPTGMPRKLSPESSHLAGLMAEMNYARRRTVADAELNGALRTCLCAGLAFSRILRQQPPLLGYVHVP